MLVNRKQHSLVAMHLNRKPTEIGQPTSSYMRALGTNMMPIQIKQQLEHQRQLEQSNFNF